METLTGGSTVKFKVTIESQPLAAAPVQTLVYVPLALKTWPQTVNEPPFGTVSVMVEFDEGVTVKVRVTTESQPLEPATVLL